MRILITLLFLVTQTLGISQEKIEVERKVRKADVPNNAVKWVDACFPELLKVKWYYEETSGHKSYEAKLVWQKNKYSIEFDERGELEDVEIVTILDQIPVAAKSKIIDYLTSFYKKYDIRKIQKQYSGDSRKVLDHINGMKNMEIVIKWEIEYYGKTKTEDELWEGLFDEKGRFIKKRKIILPSSTVLEF